jgi:AraC-like DNA-binding protein
MGKTALVSAPLLRYVNSIQAAVGAAMTHQRDGDLDQLWKGLSAAAFAPTRGELVLMTAIAAEMLAQLHRRGHTTRVPDWLELRALFEDRSERGEARRLAAFRSIEAHSQKRGRPHGTDLPARALKRLAHDYADPSVALADVAERLHVTAGHLGRVLRKQTGHGFAWHLARIRTRHAALLLRGDQPIKAIASLVGYSSVSELDRHFRHVVGITPSAYRRAANSDGAGAGAISGDG